MWPGVASWAPASKLWAHAGVGYALGGPATLLQQACAQRSPSCLPCSSASQCLVRSVHALPALLQGQVARQGSFLQASWRAQAVEERECRQSAGGKTRPLQRLWLLQCFSWLHVTYYFDLCYAMRANMAKCILECISLLPLLFIIIQRVVDVFMVLFT